AWSAPASNGGSAITGYKVYRGNSSGGETLPTPLRNVTTRTDNNAPNRTTYYYKVTALNPAGGRASPKRQAGRPRGPASSAPAATVNSANPGSGSVALAWSAPSNNGGSPVTGYNVYRGTTSGGETLLTSLGNVTTWTDNGAANGTTYYYKVTALNSVGESARSN